jgi:hypothetical protein
MPPFSYQTFQSPYANTIAQLLAHQGDPAAQAAQTVALANARAGEQVASAYGGVATGLSNAFTNAVQTVQRQQEIAPKLALEKIALDNAQQQQRGKAALNTALAGDTLGPGEAGPRLPTFRTPDHRYDIPALNEWLASRGYGAQAPDLLKTAEAQNDLLDKSQAAQEAAATKRAIYIGGVAQGALKIHEQINMPLEGALTFMAQQGLDTKQFTPEQFNTVLQRMQALPPDQQKAYLQGYVSNADRLQTPDTVKEGEIQYGRTSGAVLHTGGEKHDLTWLKMDAAKVGGPDETPTSKTSAIAVGLGPKTPTRLEAREGFVIKGTTNIPNYDPATGLWSFNQKPVPADQVVRAAPQKDPIAQALAALNLQNAQANLDEKTRRRSDIKAIADGVADGTLPSDPEGLQRNGLYGDVLAELKNRGVNYSELRQNYLAAKKLINTQNSPQGVRLDIAVRSGLAMYDKVDALSSQWDGLGIGILSQANLKAAQAGYKGPAAQQLATQLTGQIAQLTSDVATVEQNGMTPTNDAREVAAQGLQGWWGDGTIKAMTAQGRANMRIRDAARKETVPFVPGQAPGPSAPGPSAPVMWERGPDGKPRIKVGG